MDNNGTSDRITQILTKGVAGTILLAANPNPDSVAAATALYLGLHKMGKSVSLACSSKVTHNLTAVDKISSQLVTQGDNLVISFPYTEGSIDKVDYNIQGNNFNLIVSPRPGIPKLDPQQVKYSYTGGALDFIIVIDSPTLNSLGQIYIDNEKLFQGKDIINIDRHLTNSFYGTANIVDKSSSSLSEMILKLMQELGIEIDKDMATNLYAGISAATNNFSSYSVNANTFENAASLLRQGAVKKVLRKPDTVKQSGLNKPFQPRINLNERNIRPIEEVETEKTVEQTKTPEDWLKPKIFKGGGGLI